MSTGVQEVPLLQVGEEEEVETLWTLESRAGGIRSQDTLWEGAAVVGA